LEELINTGRIRHIEEINYFAEEKNKEKKGNRKKIFIKNIHDKNNKKC